MAQILKSIPSRWHVVYSPDTCDVSDSKGNLYCSVAGGGFSVFYCTSKKTQLSSDLARMHDITSDVSGMLTLVLSGEPVMPMGEAELSMQHATWFNNAELTAVAIRPAAWQNRVMTCYLKTSVPVELSGVTWLYGKPVMVAGCTYVIALQQIDTATVLANLAYTIKQ